MTTYIIRFAAGALRLADRLEPVSLLATLNRLMDPLSLTASIIAVAGASSKTVKLVRKLASLKHAPQLALDLDDELTDLRLDVLAVQDFFTRQKEEDIQHPFGDTIIGSEGTTRIIRYLEKANDLVKELDHLLCPLMDLLFYSGRIMPVRMVGWLKKEQQLKSLQKSLHQTKIDLNAVIGILGL